LVADDPGIAAHVERLAARLVAEEMLGAPAVDLERLALFGRRDDGFAQPRQGLLGAHAGAPLRGCRGASARRAAGIGTGDVRATTATSPATSELGTMFMVATIVPEPGEGWQGHGAGHAGFQPRRDPRRPPARRIGGPGNGRGAGPTGRCRRLPRR